MKRKYINKTYLEDVKEHVFKLIKNHELNCYMSIKYIKQVKKPLIVEHYNDNVCVIDNGHYILEYIPLDHNYIVRTFYDNNKRFLENYIDITAQNNIDENGMPYYDDLYLDLVLFDSTIKILDQDELEDAYNSGIISKEQFDFAYNTLNCLIDEIKNNNNPFVNRCNRDLQEMVLLIKE